MEKVKEFENKIKLKQLNNSVVFILCALIAFLSLMLCSPNSFLYAFNANQDVNWYLTLGRGMVDGKIMYKDLFDHKGPILYLVFAFIALFKHPYIAIFVLELITNTLFLFIGYKIAKRYASDYVCLIIVSVLAFVCYSSYYRVLGGGAVEEYFLPIIAYFIYCVLGVMEDKKPLTSLQCILLGVGISIIFWIKFTVFSAVIAFLAVWLYLCIVNKQIKQMFKGVIFMLIGFVIITLPVIVYFACTKSFYYLYNVYFYINLTAYNGKLDILGNVGRFIQYGPIAVVFIIIGITMYLIKNKKQGLPYLIMFLINFGILVIQKCFKYYFVQLLPYTILGVCLLCGQLAKKCNFKISKALGYFLSFVICLAMTTGISFTTKDIGRSKTEYPQIEIAATINELSAESGQKPTLFCYKIWDYGFYNAANIVPTVRFYAKNEFSETALPEMYENFRQAITTQAVEYIITTTQVYSKEEEYLTQYYHLYTQGGNNGVYKFSLTEPYKPTELEFVLLVKN